MVIEQHKQLAPMTTFGIKAEARWFVRYNSVDALRKILRTEEFQNNEWMHIGAGSNLLFNGNYNGLVLKSDIYGRTAYRKNDETVYVIAGAAENWSDFVDWCVEQGYAGLENLAGIPGEVGASPVQNVGAYGVEAGQLIHAVEVFDVTTGQVVRLTGGECGFQYRESRFKHEWKKRYIVLRVSFRLCPTTIASTLSYGPLKHLGERIGHKPTIGEVRDEIIALRAEKLPDPAILGSAGSFFRNPIVDKYFFDEIILPQSPDIIHYLVDEKHVKLGAGWLIEHAGMKGHSVGGAEVYPRQCLIIVNANDASSDDVVRLSQEVQRAVRQKFSVELQPEVNIISTAINVEVLGSGTSKGIPEIGCLCEVCRSEDPADKRLRASVWVQTHGLSIIIDPSPDFRQQALRAGIEHVDAVLLTHSHYDHVGGIDDLRPFCVNQDVPIYAQEDVIEDLQHRLDYCFRPSLYPGVPKLSLHRIEADKPLFIDGLEILPLRIFHGKLPILGFRIGKFAYITDASAIDEDTRNSLKGLDTLILNALRWQPHFAHFSIDEACEIACELKPRHTYLTHLSHQAGLDAEVNIKLPEGIRLAFDGMKIHCD